MAAKHGDEVTWWREGSLFLGILLGVLCLARVRDWPPFRITKRPAVRVNPELLAQMRSELIHDASKRIVRADFQRGYRK